MDRKADSSEKERKKKLKQMEKMTPLKEFSHLPNRYLVSLMLENGMEEERSGGFKGGRKKI